MAAPQGESSDVETIKAELEEQEDNFKNISVDFGDYDVSIQAVEDEAHSAVDGSSQQAVADLFDLAEQIKAELGEVAGTADQCAQGCRDISIRL